MIVAKNWIWLHFPKCAGTSVEDALRTLYAGNPGVVFDEIDPRNVIWHHSLDQRCKYNPSFSPEGKRILCNIRRLPDWILSRVHFEVQRSGQSCAVKRKDLVVGRFAIPFNGSVRLYSADHVLKEYKGGVTHWIRMESLSGDLASALGEPEEQVKKVMPRLNEGKIGYVRSIPFWFTQKEIDRMYAANPEWAALERSIYGSLAMAA